MKWIFAHHVAKHLLVTHLRLDLMAQCHCTSLLDDMELWNYWGWESPLGSPSPTISPHSPLNHVLKCFIHHLPKENFLASTRNGLKAIWNFLLSLKQLFQTELYLYNSWNRWRQIICKSVALKLEKRDKSHLSFTPEGCTKYSTSISWSLIFFPVLIILKAF